ncbi:hypothetical protein ALC53_07574 [Atta colombica]|uniref:Uncharacterized protein n=1 Tax=Atta colombica TaxID=520822 RepID=A0A195BBL8_9HYME|nr:hypothetical protein ALC53_07574 [Atta colombica]
MQRRASGSAISGEPAEARRLAPPDCFALRLRDLALPPWPAYVAAACTSFILGLRRDFTDRPVPFHAGVYGAVEKDEQAVTCNLELYPHASAFFLFDSRPRSQYIVS